jgi:hypothetical protein
MYWDLLEPDMPAPFEVAIIIKALLEESWMRMQPER